MVSVFCFNYFLHEQINVFVLVQVLRVRINISKQEGTNNKAQLRYELKLQTAVLAFSFQKQASLNFTSRSAIKLILFVLFRPFFVFVLEVLPYFLQVAIIY